MTEIIQNKQEKEIVEALQIVEPRITDVQLVGKRVMVDVGLPTRLPINVLGDGVRKVLAVILSIYTCRNGVLIIDELDNGLHFRSCRNYGKSSFICARNIIHRFCFHTQYGFS